MPAVQSRDTDNYDEHVQFVSSLHPPSPCNTYYSFSSVAATRLMLNIRSHDEDVRLNGSLAISTATRHTNIRFAHVTADPESSFPAEQLTDENEAEEPMQSGAGGGGASGDGTYCHVAVISHWIFVMLMMTRLYRFRIIPV